MEALSPSSGSSKVLLRLAQLGLVAIFLALGIHVSLNSNEGPDEVAHFSFNRFVASYGRLPLNEEERREAGYKSDLPPLFHLIAGTAGSGLDLESPPKIKLTRDSLRLKLVTGHANIMAWRMIRTEDPLQGEVLLWYLGRWVTLGFGLVGLGLSYWLYRIMWPGQPWLAVGSVAVLGLLPAYIRVSGITSYEPLTGALMAAYLGLLFYTVTDPERGPWLYLGLGLLLGLAAATRQTVWILLPALPVFMLWLALSGRWGWRLTLGRITLVGLGFGLTLGLWILYVDLYFNEIPDKGWFWGLVNPVLIGDGSDRTSLQIAGLASRGEVGAGDFSRQGDSFWQWGWRFFSSIWGTGWLGWLMLGIWAVALAGLARRWRDDDRSTQLWTVLLIGHVGLLLFFPLLRFIFSGRISTAMSQHLLFPAGAAMVGLLVLGLQAWLSPGRLAILLLAFAGIFLWQDISTALDRRAAPFPIHTVPGGADEPAMAEYENLTLIGVDRETDNQSLEVRLTWRTEASPSEDYRVELTLLDEAGQPRSRWVGQPLNGRYPTRAWLPEDRVRDVIELPVAGLPAGDYRLQLRLLGESGPVSAGEETLLLPGTIYLTPAPLEPEETLLVNQQPVGYRLWVGGQPARGLPLLGENGTIVVSTREQLGEKVRLKLVGPDDRIYGPVDRTGRVYNFNVAPQFTSGAYRLRVERWQDESVVAHADTQALVRVETEDRLFDLPEIQEPVSANFAGFVTLLGYDLPQSQIRPGEDLPVTLYWQAQRTIGADLVLFNHLIGPDGRQWAGQDRQARDIYSTIFWAPSEVVRDDFGLTIPANAPAGTYQLLVGLYLPVGEAAVSLPLLENGQMSDVTHAAVGPIEVVTDSPAP